MRSCSSCSSRSCRDDALRRQTSPKHHSFNLLSVLTRPFTFTRMYGLLIAYSFLFMA
jgi:hypothetical protein